MATPLAAASAYTNIANIGRIADPSAALAGATGAGAKSDTSFGSVLKEAMDAITETGKKSDTQARAMANGKSNMVDVATAVAETEVAIDAVVAVRDKVIAAYEDIMKMPI
jgi:flagellar hook-basal body complex protein FliE